MKNTSPAFQFYPQDYLSSSRVAEMTLEEEGAYIRLLCYSWTVGSIPADPERCAKLIGKGCSTDTAILVQRSFNVCSTDVQRLIHDRVEIEREKQMLRRQQTSKAGKKSADARRKSFPDKTLKTLKSRSTSVQRNVNPSSSSSDEDVCASSSKSQVVQFEEFWSAYPRKTAKGAARKAWKKATTLATLKVIMDAVVRYSSATAGCEPQYIAHPATWLNSERWMDEASTVTKQTRLPDYQTPEGMDELKRRFTEGFNS